MTPALAWNTAVSFVTNTNWQAYSGESHPGPPGADGRPDGAELRLRRRRHGRRDRAGARVRPHAAPATSATSGSTWCAARCASCCRSSVIAALILIAGGVIQNFHLHDQVVNTLAGGAADHPRRPGRQPGGHQGARHQRRRLLQRQLRAPVREPDRVDQLGRDLPAAGHRVLAAAHVRPDGRQPKQGYAIVAVMAIIATDQRHR